MQSSTDAIFCVVDLHALTIPKPAGEVRDATLRLSQLLMAAGLDPEQMHPVRPKPCA